MLAATYEHAYIVYKLCGRVRETIEGLRPQLMAVPDFAAVSENSALIDRAIELLVPVVVQNPTYEMASSLMKNTVVTSKSCSDSPTGSLTSSGASRRKPAVSSRAPSPAQKR